MGLYRITVDITRPHDSGIPSYLPSRDRLYLLMFPSLFWYHPFNYVPGPEEPEQAPLSPNYVPGPEYCFQRQSEEDDDEEPEEDPIDYPVDGGDDEMDEMDIDEDDDMDIDANKEDEDDEMDVKVDEEAEEEHLAPAYPVVVALPATAPRYTNSIALLYHPGPDSECQTVAISSSPPAFTTYLHGPSSPPQIPFPHNTTSPVLTTPPPRKRAPPLRWAENQLEVLGADYNFIATMDKRISNVTQRDMLDMGSRIHGMRLLNPTGSSDEYLHDVWDVGRQSQRQLLACRSIPIRDDGTCTRITRLFNETEARKSREAVGKIYDARILHLQAGDTCYRGRLMTLQGQLLHYNDSRTRWGSCTAKLPEVSGDLNAVARECTYQDCHEDQTSVICQGTEGVFELKPNASALTWWNSHVMTVTHDVAYSMTWVDLRKKMTDKYYPRNEMKKLEAELWNLKVIGTDVVKYNQRFQELAAFTVVRKFPRSPTKLTGKSGELLDMDPWKHRSFSKPKTMQEAIRDVQLN
ncbi:reverse transcriptase domain-containing protein [Tanacetum coccineum]|uniref:Reverse transcriptase domain-containing protein n=1 Tax=Tanacetum coccineum TaxID=301880 RepID=A0ABQ5H510_9ASTR